MEKSVSICSRLQEAMSIRNMKQADLAAKSKIPKSSISQYVTGYVEPKSDRIYLMANALNVNPVWLMGLEVPMEEKRYSAENAVLLNETKDSKEIQDLVRCYLMLSEAQQQAIKITMLSMLNKEVQ